MSLTFSSLLPLKEHLGIYILQIKCAIMMLDLQDENYTIFLKCVVIYNLIIEISFNASYWRNVFNITLYIITIRLIAFPFEISLSKPAVSCCWYLS